MKRFQPPNMDKPGAEWTRSELRTFYKWCFEEPQSVHILLKIVYGLGRKGYHISKDDLHDIWSDFCSKLYVRVQGFDPRKGRRLLDYLVAGCVQFAADNLKRDLRRQRRELSLGQVNLMEATLPLDQVQQSHQDVELQLQKRLEFLELARHIDLLPESLAAVMREHYFYGKTAIEISREMGVSANLVRVRLHRGRQKLRESFLEPQIHEKRKAR